MEGESLHLSMHCVLHPTCSIYKHTQTHTHTSERETFFTVIFQHAALETLERDVINTAQPPSSAASLSLSLYIRRRRGLMSPCMADQSHRYVTAISDMGMRHTYIHTYVRTYSTPHKQAYQFNIVHVFINELHTLSSTQNVS